MPEPYAYIGLLEMAFLLTMLRRMGVFVSIKRGFQGQRSKVFESTHLKGEWL